MERRKFSREFKIEAVKLVRERHFVIFGQCVEFFVGPNILVKNGLSVVRTICAFHCNKASRSK